MKTVLTVLIAALLIHSLALLGLLGYGLATGRFDGEKTGQYLATWRGETLVPPSAEKIVEEAGESPQEAAGRIAEAERDREILTLEIKRQQERVRNMMAALDAARANFDKELKELRTAKERFNERLAQQNDAAREEGFLKQLGFYSNMKPKLVRDDFMKMSDDEVARLLAAMSPDIAKKILNTFKTEQEQDKRLRVIALIEDVSVVKNETTEEPAL